ncbi:MAG: hypothetical protein OXB87_00565 [Hyphomicrobiales bacterium]|nr:hypothetical protein [Hyphomicrobiales bacterium]
MSRTDAPPPRLSLLLGSVLLAATASVACFYSLFLLPVAAVPLGFVGFRHGPTASASAAALAFVLAGVLGQYAGAFLFLALIALPMQCLLLTSLRPPLFVRLLHHLLPTQIILAALGLAALMLSAFYIGWSGSEGGLPQIVSDYFAAQLSRPDMQQMLSAFLPEALLQNEQFLRQSARLWLVVCPTFLFWLWLVQLGWARELAQLSGRAILKRPDYLFWRLPDAMEIVLALFLALGVLAPSPFAIYAISCATLIAGGYAMLGASLLHLLVGRSTMRRILVIGAYGLCLIYLWPIVLVAFMGLMARPMQLHKRFAYWVEAQDRKGKGN